MELQMGHEKKRDTHNADLLSHSKLNTHPTIIIAEPAKYPTINMVIISTSD